MHSEKISEEKLAVTVKNFVGKYIQSFDSIEDLASIETDGKFHLEDAVDSLKIVDGLEVSQVQEIAKKVFSQNQFASAGKVIS
ncbi:hypothetical protein [Xylocopilactobacillus apis]|uniref:Uncharacterized protein n=1 Tax=Xylocopilactobacillus apis TaxID=2932183 RepID=A0AAU9CWD0_9LACO|nr:hypothetical protein [Xylocopilactobacillus apis]BDR56736.1 hypothetical protein KIMC2_12980 [Xylocopilactobacillus apis]